MFLIADFIVSSRTKLFMKKNIIAGLGEIGTPILQLISKNAISVGYDINKNLMNEKIFKKNEKLETEILHICIPFSNKFITNVISLYSKFTPELIVIHSTVSPYTTKKIQVNLPIPVIYSATRGVHKRMLRDLKRYEKFFAIEDSAPDKEQACSKFESLMKNSGVKTKRLSNPVTLELAKIICDTSYYGWLITYAQLSNMIAREHHVDYDEMWSFSDEIHKFLGNRPKMFPGFIGGHCVIPNLDLIHNQTLDLIKTINNQYVKKVRNAKTLAKKYQKK